MFTDSFVLEASSLTNSVCAVSHRGCLSCGVSKSDQTVKVRKMIIHIALNMRAKSVVHLYVNNYSSTTMLTRSRVAFKLRTALSKALNTKDT